MVQRLVAISLWVMRMLPHAFDKNDVSNYSCEVYGSVYARVKTGLPIHRGSLVGYPA